MHILISIQSSPLFVSPELRVFYCRHDLLGHLYISILTSSHMCEILKT